MSEHETNQTSCGDASTAMRAMSAAEARSVVVDDLTTLRAQLAERDKRIAELERENARLKDDSTFAREHAVAWEKNCKDAYAAQERADKELEHLKRHGVITRKELLNMPIERRREILEMHAENLTVQEDNEH